MLDYISHGHFQRCGDGSEEAELLARGYELYCAREQLAISTLAPKQARSMLFHQQNS